MGSKKITRFAHFETTFWRYAGFVTGIHCRGEDLASFSPRHFYCTTFALIVVRMQCISVDFTSCGFVRLATYEKRVADFMSLFAFNLLSNAR